MMALGYFILLKRNNILCWFWSPVSISLSFLVGLAAMLAIYFVYLKTAFVMFIYFLKIQLLNRGSLL